MLLNGKQLAKAWDTSEWTITMLKRYADQVSNTPFTLMGGRYTTLEDANAWLRRHPNFIPTRLRKTTRRQLAIDRQP